MAEVRPKAEVSVDRRARTVLEHGLPPDLESGHFGVVC